MGFHRFGQQRPGPTTNANCRHTPPSGNTRPAPTWSWICCRNARVLADAVVCTLDLPVAYDRLLPGVPAPRAVRSGDYSPSAVVWHVGASGTPGEQVRHHNIHFGREWDGAFEALIDRGELMPDPSRLVTVPTVAPSLSTG